ncbi:MAG: hypothetical protein Q9M50_08485 [Methylococcales bacterium]|nr:hypothetical protein [Methylococcales bacterium]
MKKLKASIVTTAVISAFGATTAAHAEANPFSVTELSEGYMQLAAADTKATTPAKNVKSKKADGACGEGKCGNMMEDGKMKKGQEAKCGEMMKGKEGKCGMKKKKDCKGKGKAKEGKCGDMMKGKEGKCGMDKKAGANAKEGKCGEGKCGGMMKDGKMKKGQEAACGEMMKGKEGKCGMDKKAADVKATDKKTDKK